MMRFKESASNACREIEKLTAVFESSLAFATKIAVYCLAGFHLLKEIFQFAQVSSQERC